jgi:hypothetical protein
LIGEIVADRARELERAVENYLKVTGASFITSSNQHARCPKCGQMFRVPTEGWDFFVFHPFNRMGFIECKTGKSQLTKSQKEWKSRCKDIRVPYLVVRDSVDALIEADKERRPV